MIGGNINPDQTWRSKINLQTAGGQITLTKRGNFGKLKNCIVNDNLGPAAQILMSTRDRIDNVEGIPTSIVLHSQGSHEVSGKAKEKIDKILQTQASSDDVTRIGGRRTRDGLWSVSNEYLSEQQQPKCSHVDAVQLTSSTTLYCMPCGSEASSPDDVATFFAGDYRGPRSKLVLWLHRVLNHAGKAVMRHAYKHELIGNIKSLISKKDFEQQLEEHFCEECARTLPPRGDSHRRRTPAEKLARRRQYVAGQRWNCDINGPFTPDKEGNKYKLLLRDYNSKYEYPYLLKENSGEAVKAVLKQHIREVKRDFPNNPLDEIIFDRAGEFFKSRRVREMFAKRHPEVKLNFVPTEAHNLNPAVESRHRHGDRKTEANFRQATGLDYNDYWGRGWRWTIRQGNKVPTTALRTEDLPAQVPSTVAFGEVPNIMNMHPFGALVFVKERDRHKHKRDAMRERAKPGIYMGETNDGDFTSYDVLDPVTNKILPYTSGTFHDCIGEYPEDLVRKIREGAKIFKFYKPSKEEFKKDQAMRAKRSRDPRAHGREYVDITGRKYRFSEGKKLLVCCDCGKQFRSMRSLRNHYKENCTGGLLPGGKPQQQFNVEKIVGIREVRQEDQNGNPILNAPAKFEFRLRWKGYKSTEDTWEKEENLNSALADNIQQWKKRLERKQKRNKRASVAYAVCEKREPDSFVALAKRIDTSALALDAELKSRRKHTQRTTRYAYVSKRPEFACSATESDCVDVSIQEIGLTLVSMGLLPAAEAHDVEAIYDAREAMRVQLLKHLCAEEYDDDVWSKETRRASEIPEPKSFIEAVTGKDRHLWIPAIVYELNKMHEYEVWEPAALPPRRRCVGVKWVWKAKPDDKGELKKCRARLVARGFSQVAGVDYFEDESSSPVGRSSSLYTLLSIAAEHKWEVRQADYKSAYLRASLRIPMFVERPKFTGEGPKGKNYLLLKRALYGLHQSGARWHNKLSVDLAQLGFHKLYEDKCLFIYAELDGKKVDAEKINSIYSETVTQGRSYKEIAGERGAQQRLQRFLERLKIMLICLYVDDYAATFSDRELYNRKFKEMSAQNPLEGEAQIGLLLGMNCHRFEDGRIKVTQEQRIIATLKQFNLEGIRTYGSPMDKNARLDSTMQPTDPAEIKEIKATWFEGFRTLLGILLHMSIWGRPDIQFAVNYISSYATNPGKAHFNALHRICGYLKGSKDLGMIFAARESKDEMHAHWWDLREEHPNLGQQVVTVLSDASFKDREKSRSTGGYCVFVFGNIVKTKSTKLPLAALSTCEAELDAAKLACQYSMHVARLCLEIFEYINPALCEWIYPIPQGCDNQSTVCLATQGASKSFERTSHIDLRQNWLVQGCARKTTALVYCPTDKNVADAWTKALIPAKHTACSARAMGDLFLREDREARLSRREQTQSSVPLLYSTTSW